MRTTDSHPLRSFLLDQLREHGWNRIELAEKLGVHRATITKWMAPKNAVYYQPPSEKSCRDMAHLFGIPFDEMLALAGRINADEVERAYSPIKREIIAIVPQLADTELIVILNHLKALLRQQAEADARRRMATPSSK